MNRRRALILAAIAPITLATPALAKDESKPEALDTRPTFDRNDYVMVKTGTVGWQCEIHSSEHHGVYTRGCHPVAFDKEMAHNAFDNKEFVPVTDDAVPYGMKCPVETNPREYNPHIHNDFRWVS